MLRGLSHYRVLRQLGGGAQAAVFLAFDARLHRRVCIKLYHLQGGLAQRRHAVNEARFLTRVDSPRTVAVYDVVHSGMQLAMVTQYVPGCTLESLLAKQSTLPVANAVAIVSDLAVALAALRRARLVHGDLKAANVLIDHDGRAVLADFGTAVLAGDRPMSFSAESLAPEQSRGRAAELPTDFFALGLLLYRMLLGCHPFMSDGTLDMPALRRGLRQSPVIPDISLQASRAIGDLLQSLLAAEPGRRPATTFELRERLREIRSLLPAPLSLADAISRAGVTTAPAGPTPRLPARLLRLPFRQQAGAWLRGYWRAGSVGARGLLAAALLAPLLTATLWWSMPGPCVAVVQPRINAVPEALALLPDQTTLWHRLTRQLKDRADSATVLGAGPASDANRTLTNAGIRQACVAQRQLSLRIDCADARCLLRMQGKRPGGTRERQLDLPYSMGFSELNAAMVQLVEELSGFLLEAGAP